MQKKTIRNNISIKHYLKKKMCSYVRFSVIDAVYCISNI